MFHKEIGVTTEESAYGWYKWDVNPSHNQLSLRMLNSQKYRVSKLLFVSIFP